MGKAERKGGKPISFTSFAKTWMWGLGRMIECKFGKLGVRSNKPPRQELKGKG